MTKGGSAMKNLWKLLVGSCFVAFFMAIVSCVSTKDPRRWNERQFAVVLAFVQELEGKRLDLRNLPLKFDNTPGKLEAKTSVNCDEKGIVLRCTAEVTGGKDNLGCWETSGGKTTYKLCANGGRPISK
jgi:hypothetical protein